ncbi:type II 3-dehydroquinate dehydratase [Bartonella sp. 1-1C]|uniref:type II 3-dehydroquinate dehydratase n=1 Tax=Bartonella sp. 1-1C TaxID=515256 RepID=UPI0001F4C537
MIINPIACSCTSFAIFDALKIFLGLIGEVHLLNIYQRGSFYHLAINVVIVGCGCEGY